MDQEMKTIKGGTLEFIKKDSLQLAKLDAGEHHSLYRDVPVTGTKGPLTVGFWKLQGEGDLPYDFAYSEAILVHEGKLVVRDEQGTIYRAEAGDIFIFHAPLKVTFMAESTSVLFTASNTTEWL
ncbi:MAG: hypothetical protein V3U90_02805 [Dehalococcoidia bacterium]